MDQHLPARLKYLDGLRGIAILLVVLYHTYSSAWKDLTPFYSSSYEFPLVKFGDLGVPLFFIISGFVILMTLERCINLSDFMFKRWLRLFPGMLIATLLIVFTAPLFTARPLGEVNLIDTIPGLTFISPFFYKEIFNDPSQSMLEVGFWSLFVEVKFYLIAGWLYFAVGQKKMIAALMLMFLSYTGFSIIASRISPEIATTVLAMFDCLDYKYYGWFAAGALFYRFSVTKDRFAFIAAVLIALLSARGWGGLLSQTMLAFIVIIGIFAGAMVSTKLQQWLANPVLTWIGFISYPLYLIHENATISSIVQLHTLFPNINPYFLSIAPLSIVTLTAWLMAKYVEPKLKLWIKNICAKTFRMPSRSPAFS